MSRWVAVIAALVGCGRSGFSVLPDGAGSADGADAAPITKLDPAAIAKLSIAAPLLDSPVPNSGDCGQFLVLFAQDTTLTQDDLLPFAAVDNAGTTIWFTYNCKYADTGWSQTVGSWVPPDGVFQRYDGKPAVAGVNELVGIDDTMPDGAPACSMRQLRFAFGPDDHFYGVGTRYRCDSGVPAVVPVLTDTPLDLSPQSYDLAHAGVFDPPAEPWAVKTGLGRDVMRVGSTYYLYSVHWDGTSMTSTGEALTSIAVATTTDMQSAVFGSAPLVTGWSDPMVSAWGGSYHMVARDLSTNSYSYIHGTAPDQFDFAHAVPLQLAGHGGAPGAWDEQNFPSHGLSNDPRISTARVVNGILYMFYAAGVPPNGNVVAEFPGTAKRGLGVFAVPVPQ